MSKRGYISRYLLLLKKLKRSPFATYEELQSYIESQFDYLQMQDDRLQVGFSKRTFQRDIKEISNLFGVEITYSKTRKGYFISQSESENMNFQRMLDAFDMFNSLNITKDLESFIHLEKRRPNGTDNFQGIIHAIKNKLQIAFTYEVFAKEEFTQRLIEPYALKEFKNRWYVLGRDTKDNHIKSFALDRTTKLEVTEKVFTILDNIDIDQSYRYCYGIIRPPDETPQDVILCFDVLHGKYVKSLPLHHSQQVIIDNEEEITIQLKVFITYDFIMELLSYGENMKVIAPKSLADIIKNNHLKAFEQY